MGKLLMSVLAVVVGVAFLAPHAGAQDIKVGAKLGINMAKVDVDMVGADAESKFGVTIGAAVDVPLSGAVSLQTGIQYAMKGSEYADTTLEVVASAIEIPALAKFSLAQEKAYALAGLNIGIITKADLEVGSASMDIKDSVSGTNLELVIGAGASLADGKLNIGIQYELGLTDLNDDPCLFWGDAEAKSKTLQIVATYTF